MYILYIFKFIQLKCYFTYFLSYEYNARKVGDNERDYITEFEFIT